MYMLYEKRKSGNGYLYKYKNKISLFGCNVGYIPKLLKLYIPDRQGQPYKWHINIEKAMDLLNQSGDVLIIDLKPKSSKPNLSLYEIVDIWGYSAYDWTPTMFYLRGLIVDAVDTSKFNKNEFNRTEKEIDDPIFTFGYVSGTVNGGEIEGKWTPPGPSPTNSVLLWPDAFEYFTDQGSKIIG